jgi:hypothetical protein
MVLSADRDTKCACSSGEDEGKGSKGLGLYRAYQTCRIDCCCGLFIPKSLMTIMEVSHTGSSALTIHQHGAKVSPLLISVNSSFTRFDTIV